MQDNKPPQQCCSISTPSDLDIFQTFSSILVTIAKSQQILQCMRQILVLDPNFTPMSLFRYLAGNSNQLTRKNLLTMLDENKLVADWKQSDVLLRRVLNRYGICSNNGIQYTSYLNFIYPYNSVVLRDLLSTKVKKYPQIDKQLRNLRPSDNILTSFLLILQEQIKVQKRLQLQINDPLFPGRDGIRRAIKSIKKASEKLSSTLIQRTNETISMLELRNFIKAFIEVEEGLFLDLGRRLGMNKSGNIPIQNLETVLKKTKRNHLDDVNNSEEQPSVSIQKQAVKQNKNVNLIQPRNKRQNRQIRQANFKQQLYREMQASTKAVSQGKNKTPRNRSNNKVGQTNPYIIGAGQYGAGKSKTPNKRTPLIDLRKQNCNLDDIYAVDNNNSYRNYSNNRKEVNRKKSYGLNNSKQNIQNSFEKASQIHQRQKINSEGRQTNSLFKQFIQTFLRGHKQIQKCKSRLSSTGNIDFLSIFKTLDNGRGVIDAESMQKFYTKLSGIPTDYDFQLIIDRFAQPQQKWLAYSQFSDIFRCPTTKAQAGDQSCPKSGCQQINGIRINPQSVRLLAQIIYLTLDLEFHLHKILNKFKKNQIQWLFGRINIDSESKGFINYQQLKKYLGESLGLAIPMVDLMSLLKRLDKGKNGVVLRQQFLST